MRKKVRSYRSSDTTEEKLKMLLGKSGLSAGQWIEQKVLQEEMENKIAIRMRSIRDFARWKAVNDLLKETMKEKNLSLKEAGNYLITQVDEFLLGEELLNRTNKIELHELQWGGISNLSENTPEFETKDNWCPHCDTEFPSATALKKHVKAEHPDQFDAMYKSGKKVLT